MITCGYCESQNQNNNQSCIACGGSLVDEISQERNKKRYEPVAEAFFCPDPKRSNSFVKWGVTVDEAYNVVMQVFG